MNKIYNTFMLVAGLVVFLFILTGIIAYEFGQSDIINDCNHFDKFYDGNQVYSCEKVKQ